MARGRKSAPATSVEVGAVIESTAGMFAKVIEQKGSRFGLSAWVFKKDKAEAETVVMTYLNRIGLAQVMGTDATPKATAEEAE